MLVSRRVQTSSLNEALGLWIIDFGDRIDVLATSPNDEHTPVSKEGCRMRHTCEMHWLNSVEAHILDVKDLRGRDAAGRIVVRTSSNQDIPAGQQSCPGITTPSCHCRGENREFARRRIVEFGRVCALMTDPTAGNEHLPGSQ